MLRYLSVFFFILVFLSGCQTTTSLSLIPYDTQKATYVEGETAIKSTLPNSTVILSSVAREINNGSRIDVVVNVNNTSDESFVLDTSSVKISSPQTGSLKVYSYDELVAEQKKSANTAAGFAALAGVLDVMAASYSGYQTTSGTYSGSTYGSYSGSSYGTYNANTYGTYSSTTYNSAAAQQAMDAASDRAANNIQNIQRTSAASLKSLKDNILKKTTMEPGMWYGGVTRFDAPELQDGENRIYELKVRLGQETHTFQLGQRINKK